MQNPPCDCVLSSYSNSGQEINILDTALHECVIAHVALSFQIRLAASESGKNLTRSLHDDHLILARKMHLGEKITTVR